VSLPGTLRGNTLLTKVASLNRFKPSLVLLSLGVIAAVWIATQALWQAQGVGRDFAVSPNYLTPLRFAALVFLIASTLYSRASSVRNNKYLLVAAFCAGLAFWGFASEYLATGNIWFSGETYTYLSLAIISLVLSRKNLDLRNGVALISRLVIWSSLALAVVIPSVVFGAGSSRISLLGSETRLSGVVGDANTLSFFALVLITLSIGGRSKLSRFDLLMSLVVLALTQSRFGAILAAIIFVSYFFVNRNRRFLNYVVPLSFLIGFSVFVFGLNQRLNVYSIDGSDFWNTRLVIWKWASTTIESEPLTGLGLTNYYQAIAQSGSFWVHSHNQVLQDILTGGYIRALLVVGLMIAMAIIAQRLSQDFQSIFLVAILVLYSQVEVPLFLDSFNYRFLGLLLVIVWICNYDNKSVNANESIADRKQTNVK
jgi:hypothetical protein